jgi:proline iminopeptidase
MTEVREWAHSRMQVITFEQRGIGMNDCGDYTFTMADYINDINNIARFFEIKKFHLFGHSWGGLYAQLYAEEFPKVS